MMMTKEEAKRRVVAGENPATVSVDHWQRMYEFVEKEGKISIGLPINSTTCGLCISATDSSGIVLCCNCAFFKSYGMCVHQDCYEHIDCCLDGEETLSLEQFLSYMKEMIDLLKELTPAEM